MLRLFSYPLFLFLLFIPCFPARFIPDSVTVIPTSDSHRSPNNTWHDFVKFMDVEKGSHVDGISELKKYFQRFGYLPVPKANLTDLFDNDLESAVTLYQKNLGLPVTGQLDSHTVSAIMSPRCGVSDTHNHNDNGSYSYSNSNVHTTRHYTYFYGEPRWRRTSPVTLTYAFSKSNMLSYISFTDVKAIFSRAFTRWSRVIPVTFTEVEDYETADVRIGFYHGDHGDGEAFDGVLGVLAHAFSPENGRFHLDAAETWAVDDFKGVNSESKVAVDLESVATHEIGHVLGLAHSSVKEAVMYPSLSPRTKKVDLKIDDVEGVQALYGSNPDFKFSSLSESENSSNNGIGLFRSCVANCYWSILCLVFALLVLEKASLFF